MQRKTEKLQVVMPTGEWKNWVIRMLQIADPSLNLGNDKTLYQLQTAFAQKMNVGFGLARPMDVASVLTTPGSQADVGITGSDCWQETWLRGEGGPTNPLRDLQVENLPQPAELFPQAPTPKVVLFATPNAPTRDRSEIAQADPSTIITSPYPSLTQAFLGVGSGANRSTNQQPVVIDRGGSQEGEWQLNPRIGYSVDVTVTGRTAAENGLTQLCDVLAPVLLIALTQIETDRKARLLADFLAILRDAPDQLAQNPGRDPLRPNYWNS